MRWARATFALWAVWVLTANAAPARDEPLATYPAACAPGQPLTPLARLRVLDPLTEERVHSGRARSGTFRDLIDRLERSHWIVFVQSGACPDPAAVGCLMHVVGTYEGRPYLRVLVSTRGWHADQVIGTVGHELHHAWEVISAGSVTDGPSMLALFGRISSSRARIGRGVFYETSAALRTGTAVVRELRRCAWPKAAKGTSSGRNCRK